MGLPIGQSGFAGVGGMLVVWRRIEFLSHVGPPSARQRIRHSDVPQQVNRDVTKAVQIKPSGRSEFAVANARKRAQPEFLCRMIDIAQTGAATSGRQSSSMRLHPDRQHEFAVLSRINSDPSPFGIYPLAPLDLIARPEDCAGKVLTNRSDKRRCAASYRRAHPVVK
jgi:hypothetical protein